MMQPGSESSSSSPRKLCVAFHGEMECSKKPNTYEINFYIVDVPGSDSGLSKGVEYPLSKPTIQFKCSEFPRVAFCVLGSTLYIFAGDNLYKPRGVGVKPFKGKYAAKFEFSPAVLAESGCKVVEKKDLDPINRMRTRKNYPIAVPTPDGKGILVFSSDFYWMDLGRYDSSFELYNVAENSWSLIPELPKERHFPNHGCANTVIAYGFVSDSLSRFQSLSRFVIQLNKGLVFVLNLQSLEWEPEQDIIVPPLPWREGYYFGFDKLYFTPQGAYHLSQHGMKLFKFKPNLSTFPDDFEDVDERDYATLSPCIALLGDEYEYDKNGAFDIALVQAQRPSEAGAFDRHSFCVALDICTIDLEQIRGDMPSCEGQEQVIPRYPSLKRTNSQTVKLMVNFDLTSYIYGAMKLFSI